MQQRGINFSIFKNTKCSTYVLEQLNVNSALECAVECTHRHKFKMVNFKTPECKIVASEYGVNETMIAEDE